MLPELLERWIERVTDLHTDVETLPTLSRRGAPSSPITLPNYQRQRGAIINFASETACKAGGNVM